MGVNRLVKEVWIPMAIGTVKGCGNEPFLFCL
jgi:hypothetical protein